MVAWGRALRATGRARRGSGVSACGPPDIPWVLLKNELELAETKCALQEEKLQQVRAEVGSVGGSAFECGWGRACLPGV